MLAMNADKWVFPLTMCFMCVSSNDDQRDERSCGLYSDSCQIHTLHAPLGSSVLLPCNFPTGDCGWVSWNHTPGVELVQLKSDGRVRFLLPKGGRVKSFPNQCSRGNYSIRMDELEDADLGRYCCVQGDNCHQVELVAAADTLTQGIWLLIYICVGAAAVILLIVCSYLRFNKRTQNITGPTIYVVNIEGADNNNLVYENDDHDPAQQVDPSGDHSSPPGALLDVAVTTPPTQSSENQQHFKRADSVRKKLRFQRELLHRLRPASYSRQYYVNQGEINRQQQAMPAQVENHRRDHEYKNPIYNRGADQLNRP